MSAPLLGRVLAALGRSFGLAAGAEVALEANPEDVDPGRLEALAALGVSRLSLGVQSLDDRLLVALRRPHDSRRALEAIDQARRSRVRSVGVDMILGLPEQDRGAALRGIERVLERGVDHLSLYLLEVHERTLLGRRVALGRTNPMEADAAAALYDAAADRLAAGGFEQYEISNFARPGHRSRHNLKYWTDQEYVGFGPSAHSYVGGKRWSNRPDLAGYLARGGVGSSRVEDPQPPAARGFEAMIAGLRLAEGVDLAAIRERYGTSLPSPDDPGLVPLLRAGLVDLSGSRLRLTRRGRLVSNDVLERLLPTKVS